MYLLVVVVLTMSTVSLGSLLFDFVNVYLPDAAAPRCAYDSCAGGIRTAFSVLVVAFPVLVWAWRFLQRDIASQPAKAHALVRRWLLYFTLFVAGGVVIGDLISLINNWLAGELTPQFLLKVLAVLVIAGSVFYYFLRELHSESRRGNERWVARGAIVVVIISLALGLKTAGLPSSARDRNLDNQRVNDLQQIQNQIVGVYWAGKGTLPAALADLRDSISGFAAPTDPVTKTPYDYTVTGGRSFRLCAVFTTASQSQQSAPRAYYGGGGDWGHGEGRVCFDRTIDSQLYPPKLKVP